MCASKTGRFWTIMPSNETSMFKEPCPCVPAHPQVFVIVQSGDGLYCPLHSSKDANVTLESIRRKEDGWKAAGHAHCLVCGAAADAITAQIPVLASTFKCPKCQHSDGLKYQIETIEQTDQQK